MARGVIVYRGPSLIDGGPVVAIASFRSANRKTGDMPQVWILREDVPPTVATRSGADRSICGDCPLRGKRIEGHNVGRSCYVAVGHGPTSVWLAYRRGAYSTMSDARLRHVFAGAMVRLGAYGDPAAVPSSRWRSMLGTCRGWTAYTHQWRDGFDLQDIAMASCETDGDAREAIALGYRVFRVRAANSEPLPGYMTCPASNEHGRRSTCLECRACNGGTTGPHIQVQVHGPWARHALPVLAA